jgi:hypothetical protein
VAHFQYLRTPITNQNLIQKEIKKRVNSSIASYNIAQTVPFIFRLLYKNIRLNKIIMLPVIVYGSEIWPLIAGKGQRLRVFEYRVLRRGEMK